ncbi:MAG: hypothetical protein K6F34_01840 [Lachnospiraceae bacterium]|nr:hypothetical protein [Lachnospiraceae bacterium]
MLKKLFLHEWKDSWKIMTLLSAAVLVLSLIGAFLFQVDDVLDSGGDVGGPIIALMYTSYFMVYFLSILALSVMVTLLFYIRFYKNLYTDQGYLMHTLPVTPKQLIWSKAFVAIIWRVISGVVVVSGISILLSAGVDISFFDIVEDLIDGFLKVYEEDPMLMVVYLILALFAAVGSMLFSVFKGYTAISLGQMSSKNKALASVGIYFGIHITINICTNVCMQTSMLILAGARVDLFEMLEDPGLMMVVFLAILNVGIYALTIAGYAITHHIMKNRLNLE